MAEERDCRRQNPALKKLYEQLTCPVCLEVYKEPKVLDCHHVFCSNCAEGLAGTGNSLKCPTCREETTVPGGTISKLKPAFHIHSLFDIKEALLEQRSIEPAAKSKPDANDSVNMLRREYCPTHSGRLLDMYCECCAMPICCVCIIKTHKGHSFSLFADVLQQQRDSVSLHGKMLEQQLQVVDSILGKVEQEAEQVKSKQSVIEEKMQRNFEMFQKVLNLRHRELVDCLNDATQQKLKTLRAKKAHLEKVKATAYQQLGTVQQTSQLESVADTVTAKKQLMEVLEEASVESSKLISATPVEFDMSFFYGQNDIESLSSVGKIYTQVPSPQNSTLQVADSIAMLELGDTFTMFLDVKDQYGAWMDAQPCDIDGELLPCGLMAKYTSTSGLVTVSKASGGRYKVSCTPGVRGRQRLEVKVHGEHVIGSPILIFIKPPPTVYRNPLNCVKGLRAPWGVAVTSNNHVIVTECEKHCVRFFSEEAVKTLQTLGKKSLTESHFQQPACVFVDHDDHIYVTEQQTFAINKCGSDGEVIKSVGSPGDTPLRFKSPMGISMSPMSGKLYVADMDNNRIQVLNPDLTFHSVITGSADGKHRICQPSDVAFDSDGTMYVTDNENHCIGVYSPEYDFLRTIGRKGKHRGQLALPFGICLDDKGHIFVAEAFNDRVSVFETASGKFVCCFGSHGTEPGQFNRPHNIAMDKAGYLYVTDTGNNRLQVF